MDESEHWWLQAVAGVEADAAADVRAEAWDVYTAEAARLRLHDRGGALQIRLRCGAIVRGSARPAGEAIDGMLRVGMDGHRELLIPVGSIVQVTGLRAGLRNELGRLPETTLSSVLRESAVLGDPVRLLLRDGRWVSGAVVLVGADHVDLVERTAEGSPAGDRVTIPLGSVDAWDLGRDDVGT